jgi:hypothetical protein
MTRKLSIALVAVASVALASASAGLADKGDGGDGHHLLLKSAHENAALTQVTLPLYRGTSGGGTVWYVITDASTKKAAHDLDVNFAPKLANAANTASVEHVTVGRGGIDFPATVNFAPNRFISAGDYSQCAVIPFLPFGPACFAEGADGNPGYSPLIQLPDGTVLNASHVANSTGQTDKALSIDTAKKTVTFFETTGFFNHQVVHYFSVDASVRPGAVLENVTFAPALALTPTDPLGPGDENRSALSSRAGIIAFTNGQTGLGNRNRQGLNSTILDGPTGFTPIGGPVPLNIIQAVPKGKDADEYSPLWDVHFTTWQVPYNARVRQTDFEDVRSNPKITNPAGGPFAPSGPVANCPIVSIDGKDARAPQ